ncbi:MAG: conjugal transfer protein TraF [Pseudomonadota bacterium]
MKKFALVSFAALAAAATAPTFAQSSSSQDRDEFYCEERKLGSWFYCNSEKVKRERERAAAPAQSVPAVQRMEDITKQLDELKALAILEPTSENIVNYIRFQREQLDRASTFADVWGRAIWQNPELDYTLERPVGTLAKQTWLEDRRDARVGSMEALTQRYGVFYFYSSTCSACRTFSPVMRALSDNYGLEVLAVSMDGGPNEHFPNFVIDQGQYQRMGLQGGTVPALVLFDTHTKQPVPIGYGVMAADDVMQRIFYLTQIEPGSDY